MIGLKSLLALLTLTMAGVALNAHLVRPADPHETVDLLLVIDATASMGPAVESFKQSAAGMFERLEQVFPGAHLRLGLVAYRDQGDSYLARRCPLADEAVFLGCVGRLRAGGGGGGAEAVLAGLEAAAGASWRRNADYQAVVLIGDAPGHGKNREAVERLVAAEHARGRVFHTLQLGAHPAARAQWRRIAVLGGGTYDVFAPSDELGWSITGLWRDAATPWNL